jgi:dipeptide/tripeptide permease
VSTARRALLLGGIALAIVGMCHGTWYAIFAEHQALDRIGESLAKAFTLASERNVLQVRTALAEYRDAKYAHERQVDAHGHWIGLAMLLIVLSLAFDRLALAEKQKLALAIGLLAGATLFPLTVLLQIFSHGPVPRVLTVASSALMIATLAVTALGLSVKSSIFLRK